MLVPLVAVNLTDRLCTRSAVGIDTAQLSLRTVTTNVETLQIDENLLTNRKFAIERTLVDANQDTTRLVLQTNLVVKVATEIITGNITLDLDVLVYLFISLISNEAVVVFLQLCNCDDILLLDIIVTDRSRRHLNRIIRISITIAHARCKKHTGKSHCYE